MLIANRRSHGVQKNCVVILRLVCIYNPKDFYISFPVTHLFISSVVHRVASHTQQKYSTCALNLLICS